VAIHGTTVSQGNNHQAIMTRQNQSMSNQFVPSQNLNGPAFTHPPNISLNTAANQIGQASQQHSNHNLNSLPNQ
jgi:hypothetical protein